MSVGENSHQTRLGPCILCRLTWAGNPDRGDSCLCKWGGGAAWNFVFEKIERKVVLDHNDPSKPSHRLTNGTEPSKTIESDGNKIKNHWKTIDSNGQTAEKHSMVMVSSKTIENLQWSLQNQIHNGFLKTIGLVNGPLKSTLS